MGSSFRLWLSALFLASQAAPAQTVIEDNRSLASDTPEAWAMRYFAGTTLMTSFGETARLGPWDWNIAFDLGSIPHLSDAQQRVGFGGFKNEDLNKSPVFGRLRLALGLPGAWVAELGYTPPLEIGGSRARNVVALAVGGRLFESDAFSLFVPRAWPGRQGPGRHHVPCTGGRRDGSPAKSLWVPGALAGHFYDELLRHRRNRGLGCRRMEVACGRGHRADSAFGTGRCPGPGEPRPFAPHVRTATFRGSRSACAMSSVRG